MKILAVFLIVVISGAIGITFEPWDLYGVPVAQADQFFTIAVMSLPAAFFLAECVNVFFQSSFAEI